MKWFLWVLISLILISSIALSQWEPEVLLHRQGDRLGWFYEKVEGLGDWTGDGINDFAVLTNASVVDFWWGGETLSSDPDTSLNRPDSSYFYDIKVAGDLTGDGISELVFACWDHILVYRGGRGQVEELQILPVDVTDIAVPGDISGDGVPDLVVGYAFPNGRLLVYLGTPTGFEGPVETLEGIGRHLGHGLTAGVDMNGDGWEDFACTFHSSDTTFALFHPQPESYLNNYEIFKGNFAALIPQAYHSGRPALVLAYRNVHLAQNTLYVHLGGNGLDTIPDAAFSLPELLSMSIPSYAGDVNDDGWGDWVAGSHDNFGDLGAFVLFLGGPWISNYSYGHGGFNGYWGEGKHMNGLGDVNGDGVDDFGMICALDMGGYDRYGQIVVFAGDSEWHVAADDKRPVPVHSPVTIQAYPNPFNASTRIVIEGLHAGSPFDLSIHNILGQEVFHSQERAVTDRHTSAWQPDQSLSGGIYFCSVHMAQGNHTTKLLLVR